MTPPVSIQRPLPACVAALGEHGNVIVYHKGELNHCPSCGHTQWFVGRQIATCAHCDAHMPIVLTFSPTPQTEIPLKEAA